MDVEPEKEVGLMEKLDVKGECSPPPRLSSSQSVEQRLACPAIESIASAARNRYVSAPEPPPAKLWDVDDSQFLDKVRCSAKIRLTNVDPKCGRFDARMKCSWFFRTLNSGDRTEVHLKTPGIRMPGMMVQVEESRIWRDLPNSSDKSIAWRGTSMFSLAGYEIFEMKDFPFDRQIINFELLDFVWRPDKDAATYDFSMRIVEFELEVASLLPEWATYPALVYAENEQNLARGPSSASRFRVCLRIERKHWYYVMQVFLVTYLITTVSCFPLAMPPTEDHIGDRLSLYGGGVLTLVAFKYGIADHLPSVPYSTFVDHYLLWQIVTLIMLAVETLIAYRIVLDSGQAPADSAGGLEQRTVDALENVLLGLLMCIWAIYFLYAAFFKKRRPWAKVFESQDTSEQITPEPDEL